MVLHYCKSSLTLEWDISQTWMSYGRVMPRMEELGLGKKLRLSKFPTSFRWSPSTYQTRYHGSLQDFEHVFPWVNRVPVAQKIDLKIQIFKVWSPPWADGNVDDAPYMSHEPIAMHVYMSRKLHMSHESVTVRVCMSHEPNMSHELAIWTMLSTRVTSPILFVSAWVMNYVLVTNPWRSCLNESRTTFKSCTKYESWNIHESRIQRYEVLKVDTLMHSNPSLFVCIRVTNCIWATNQIVINCWESIRHITLLLCSLSLLTARFALCVCVWERDRRDTCGWCINVCVRVRVCVGVCVCVKEREGACVFVSVFAWVKDGRWCCIT